MKNSEKKTETINEVKINKFVVDATFEEKNIVPETGCLALAEFFYKGWKTTHSNNSNTNVVGVDFRTGRKMYQLLGRICALCNGGGGIVLWGVDPETLCAEGISLPENDWVKIDQEVKYWPDIF